MVTSNPGSAWICPVLVWRRWWFQRKSHRPPGNCPLTPLGWFLTHAEFEFPCFFDYILALLCHLSWLPSFIKAGPCFLFMASFTPPSPTSLSPSSSPSGGGNGGGSMSLANSASLYRTSHPILPSMTYVITVLAMNSVHLPSHPSLTSLCFGSYCHPLLCPS